MYGSLPAAHRPVCDLHPSADDASLVVQGVRLIPDPVAGIRAQPRPSPGTPSLPDRIAVHGTVSLPIIGVRVSCKPHRTLQLPLPKVERPHRRACDRPKHLPRARVTGTSKSETTRELPVRLDSRSHDEPTSCTYHKSIERPLTRRGTSGSQRVGRAAARSTIGCT